MKFIFTSFVLVLLLSSCEVLKSKKSSDSLKQTEAKKDSSRKKEDVTNSVSKNESSKEQNNQYEKTTTNYQKDPVTNKIYPTVVIRETGTINTKEAQSSYDSLQQVKREEAFIIAVNSLKEEISTINKDKKSETKGLGLWLIVIAIVGYDVIKKGAIYLFNNYKIKKQ